ETLLERETLKAEEFESLLSGKALEKKDSTKNQVADEALENAEGVSEKGFGREVKAPGGRVTPVPEVQ
ncbi:MAG: hypothetical protein ACOYEQ_10520, partial [Bacillota bacterium]